MAFNWRVDGGQFGAVQNERSIVLNWRPHLVREDDASSQWPLQCGRSHVGHFQICTLSLAVRSCTRLGVMTVQQERRRTLLEIESLHLRRHVLVCPLLARAHEAGRDRMHALSTIVWGRAAR